MLDNEFTFQVASKDEAVRQFADEVEDKLRLDDGPDGLSEALMATKDEVDRSRMELSRKEANKYTYEVRRSVIVFVT